MPFPRRHLHHHLKTGILGLVVSLIGLLPWWHNHEYLRDFYDYGLFIDVNARLAEGQRPFADFTTPAQCGTFLLNSLAERAGGGTYVGMTRGAAVLIVLGGMGLTFLLARRFNPWLAAFLALAIIAGSASQHTIIFYNPIGVIATALVVWSFAVAPLLRRETAGWHVLAAGGLLLGGLNKVNFHVLACVMAFGWICHAWLVQKAPLSRVLLTIGFLAGCGLVLPVAFEIAWTGAGWQKWYYNVVQLPLGARGSRISFLFSPKLYLTTVHNYYGELRVPQTGLIGVLMPVIAVIAAWRGNVTAGQRWRAIFLVLAGLLAAFASSALLLTNNEIAYVTLAAALVIAIGLWLGFEVPARGGWMVAGLLVPALILAAAGWESAWRGERSQFGHDRSPRESYVLGETSGADFGYLRGLHIPARMGGSLAVLAAWRSQLPGDDSSRLFFGPGAAWLGHVWPVKNVKDLPLIPAAFDGPRENELLKREVIAGDHFRHLIVVEAWDTWNPEVSAMLARTTVAERLGTVLLVYRKFKPGTVSSRPLDFIASPLGGNVDGSRIVSAMARLELADGRQFLGADRQEGRVDVNTPCNRIFAEYVVARASHDSTGPLTAHLAAYANMEGSLLPRWNADVTLPAGVDERVERTELIDASGQPLTFTVTIPDQAAGRVRAGWRAFQLTDTSDREALPPMLQSGGEPAVVAAPAVRPLFLPASLSDVPAITRRALAVEGALALAPAGEVWVRLVGLTTNIKVTTRALGHQPGVNPLVNVIYYKGGRIERFAPVFDPATSTARFECWSCENGGWIGILNRPEPTTPTIAVKIESAIRH
ncbi:MAG TPA: hypothetical protein VG734_14045 [Lacunisphaera sp.]|nr:hypothetical protein [Lacunisphaera sp.]